MPKMTLTNLFLFFVFQNPHQNNTAQTQWELDSESWR